MNKVIFIKPDGDVADGIRDYQAKLLQSLQSYLSNTELKVVVTTLSGLNAVAMEGDILHFQFPQREWKYRPFLITLAIKKLNLRKVHVIVTLHEWAYHHWIRRLIETPDVLSANALIFADASVEAELEQELPISVSVPRTIINIGRNIQVDADLRRSDVFVDDSRVINIGSFGFLYEKKLPLFGLEIIRAMRDQLDQYSITYTHVGEFDPVNGKLEKAFWKAVNDWKLSDVVSVTGYLKDEEEVLRRLANCDCFISLHEREFNSRNGSALACLQFGKIVFSNVSHGVNGSELGGVSAKYKNLHLLNQRLPTLIAGEIIERLRQTQTAVSVEPDIDEWNDIASAHFKFYRAVWGSDVSLDLNI